MFEINVCFLYIKNIENRSINIILIACFNQERQEDGICFCLFITLINSALIKGENN